MRTSAWASLYYTTDALGSVILLADNNQAKTATYTYDSWGQHTATGTQAATNPCNTQEATKTPPPATPNSAPATTTGAAGSDDLSDVGWFEATSFQFVLLV